MRQGEVIVGRTGKHRLLHRRENRLDISRIVVRELYPEPLLDVFRAVIYRVVDDIAVVLLREIVVVIERPVRVNDSERTPAIILLFNAGVYIPVLIGR